MPAGGVAANDHAGGGAAGGVAVNDDDDADMVEALFGEVDVEPMQVDVGTLLSFCLYAKEPCWSVLMNNVCVCVCVCVI